MYKYIKDNNIDYKDVNCFILNPESMAVYFSKTFIAIPDFFVVRANGYADIVEFKLPKVKRNTVVERNNREQFSAEINSYIAQTRVYRSYFEDPNNRRWFEKKYGFKVYKPKRYLVVGRRNDFECDEWIEIKSDYTDVEIVTYDDLVDTVVSQFYQ